MPRKNSTQTNKARRPKVARRPRILSRVRKAVGARAERAQLKKYRKLNSKPQQKQKTPGLESKMQPQPEIIRMNYRPSAKLDGKAALITGGDSGIGRSIAIHFAKEGADVAIVYLSEDSDAERTRRMVEAEGRRCLLFRGDVGNEKFCTKVVDETVRMLGHLEILVNNAAEQHPTEDLEEITSEQLESTFRTNFFGYFYMVKSALKYLEEGATIINTTSVTAYKGSSHLVDYSATKGAIVSFTRSLSELLVKKGIRVNGVAPGPIWTPLIPSTFDAKHTSEFGKDYPMERAGQPSEVAPSYVFLASEDASFMSGQILHPNGGKIVES